MLSNVYIFLAQSLALFIARFVSEKWLQSFTTLNMVFIPLLGVRLVDVGGFVSNVGNFFYAFALLGFSLLVHTYGRAVAYQTLGRVFAMFVFIFGITQILMYMPVVAGNELIAQAQATLYGFTPNVIVASFVAMMLAITSFIYLTERLKGKGVLIEYLFVISVAQAIDSLIFFPIAFGSTVPFETMTAWMIDGFIIKIGIAVLTTPLFWFLIKNKKV